MGQPPALTMATVEVARVEAVDERALVVSDWNVSTPGRGRRPACEAGCGSLERTRSRRSPARRVPYDAFRLGLLEESARASRRAPGAEAALRRQALDHVGRGHRPVTTPPSSGEHLFFASTQRKLAGGKLLSVAEVVRAPDSRG
jgi:hypothetical protein